jgi:hypothetical protein
MRAGAHPPRTSARHPVFRLYPIGEAAWKAGTDHGEHGLGQLADQIRHRADAIVTLYEETASRTIPWYES